MATHHKSKIAQIVAFNGLLFHTFFRTGYFRSYDIILTVYVNAKAKDPWILFFTIIAIIGFMNNTRAPKEKITRNGKRHRAYIHSTTTNIHRTPFIHLI